MIENVNLNKKNGLHAVMGKEDRHLSLREQAKQTGVMLGDGRLWDGIERRTSRLLAWTGVISAGEKKEEKGPSIFFG